MSNKRVRGVAVHRPILYGSTSTPLTVADKLAAPPDHSHKWTVSVRSAASHPLPSLPNLAGLPPGVTVEPGSETAAMTAASDASAANATGSATSAGGVSISTRGRDQEHDYHKMVGGKDDLSHFIKRVQFKLHDTYPQATRNVDKPPFSVTETGWGEFEIQIKVFFVPEANEKPITLFHHLKLHPWLSTVAAADQSATSAVIASTSAPTLTISSGPAVPEVPVPVPVIGATAETEANNMALDEPTATPIDDAIISGTSAASIGDDGEATKPSAPMTGASSTDTSAARPALPPVVHSWQYDEIVFPEPMEAFYEILTTHPPTPLPASSAQAFLDQAAYKSYQYASQKQLDGDQDAAQEQAVPPHPLHTPTGYLFDALSLESQQAEADRLEMARIAAVKEIEKGREQLIKVERVLKDVRAKISIYPPETAAPVAGSAPPLSPAETSATAV